MQRWVAKRSRQGVAVVHYDCESVKLLGECHVDGNYGFVGITRKEQVVSLANADEAKANLPLNGGAIGASMQRGAALDVALVMVGKDTASTLGPWIVTADELEQYRDGEGRLDLQMTVWLNGEEMGTDTLASTAC